MVSKVEEICLQRGLKMTGQRKVIARVISEAKDHPHAEDVYARASAIDSKISLATVYRTINLLEKCDIIEKLQLGEGKARYELKTEEDMHYHLIDVKTGKVVEFYDSELEKIKERVAKKLGYKVVGSSFRLFGVREDDSTAEEK